MDFQTVFNVSAGLLGAVLGWLAKEMWDACRELREDLAKLREELPKEYVAKEDYRADIKRVHELLDKIYDMIAGKADK